MIDIEKVITIPIMINIVTSTVSGIYHWYKFQKSGMIIANYKHSVLDKEEVITYIVILVISTALAFRYNTEYLLAICLLTVLGSLAKFKMAQDITLTEKGILIKGKFEKWINVRSIDVKENNIVDVNLKKRAYEIIKLEDIDDFIRLSKSYYGN